MSSFRVTVVLDESIQRHDLEEASDNHNFWLVQSLHNSALADAFWRANPRKDGRWCVSTFQADLATQAALEVALDLLADHYGEYTGLPEVETLRVIGLDYAGWLATVMTDWELPLEQALPRGRIFVELQTDPRTRPAAAIASR